MKRKLRVPKYGQVVWKKYCPDCGTKREINHPTRGDSGWAFGTGLQADSRRPPRAVFGYGVDGICKKCRDWSTTTMLYLSRRRDEIGEPEFRERGPP